MIWHGKRYLRKSEEEIVVAETELLDLMDSAYARNAPPGDEGALFEGDRREKKGDSTFWPLLLCFNSNLVLYAILFQMNLERLYSVRSKIIHYRLND